MILLIPSSSFRFKRDLESLPFLKMEAGITRSFLEGILNERIESFVLSPGSNVGDNYTSLLHSITISLPGNSTHLHLILKSYPVHPARQQFLEDTQLFQKELLVYKSLVPTLNSLAKSLLGTNGEEEDLQLPFPPLVHGRASKEADPLSNYLLMVDIRKTWGYRMPDRFQGLDFPHCRILMKELAKIHALSWAYKVKTGLTSLTSLHPCLKEPVFGSSKAENVEVLLAQGFGIMSPLLEKALGPHSPVVTGYKGMRKESVQTLSSYLAEGLTQTLENLTALLRVKPPVETIRNSVPWRVGCHGDCWTNNILFLYDKEEPIKLILVDLQLFREACPTTDLSYFFYTSTTHDLRLTHLDSLLDLYSQHFLGFCKVLGIPPLPGFSPEELRGRFHLTKPFGLLMATIVLPMILRSPAEGTLDMDKRNGELHSTLLRKHSSNQLISDRIVPLAQELYKQGII